MVVLFAYTIFVYVRCVQTNVDEGRSNLEKMYMKFMAVYMSLGVVPNLAVILNKDIIPAFNNSLLKFSADFEVAYFKKPSTVLTIQKITTRLLGSLYYSCLCVTILMTMNGILRPNSPEQLASVFDTNSKALNIVSAVFYGYIECIYRAATSKNYTNSNKVPGLKCIGVLAIVGCSYAGVRMDGIPAYAFGYLGVVILSFLAVLLSYFGEFHHRSSKFLLELKMTGHRVAEKNWMRKYAQAMPPLKAVMRSHYFIDRPMVLNFANIILLQSCNFLLANP
ncbi:unnamed protein product [Allacma fusca]|uniref:Uncharacterized protein n=1 Tax=Allacma fusca TaxID=39272 RepID=A0A8J2KIB8_9HEXA|nr:unnamed protein product [Allacma fusca]